MANTTTSYAQFLKENPDLVEQAIANNSSSPAPEATQPQAAQVEQPKPVQAQPVQSPSQPVQNPYTINAQLQGQGEDVPVQGPQAPSGEVVQPKQKNDDGVKGIAKMVASFYTGGAASGAMGAAGGDGSGGPNQGSRQGASKSSGGGGEILGLLGSLFGGGFGGKK